ncbi:hypothetical protein E3J38_06515, partial [candidate division TA06 bacterium]
MKLLKIEDNAGWYLNDQGGFVPIDKITKQDLLRLVSLTLAEETEVDEFDAEAIKNQAHQLIYKSVSEKLGDLRERRQAFTDQSEPLYLQQYDKYPEVSTQQKHT